MRKGEAGAPASKEMVTARRTVLKYPGSKWGIAEKLVRLIPSHHSYVEPFFGSGAVFFSKQESDIETINDLDSNVVNLFLCIQENAEHLARLIMTTPFSREIYDASYDFEPFVTEIQSEEPYRKALLFLIQCWQGHGFRTRGGKVGWKHDVCGRERMYALWNWYRLPEWVLEIAERLRQVQIEHRPALEVIKRFDYEEVFLYLDPPYLLQTRRGKQYRYEMSDADHEELLETILTSRAKIMISGYDSELYNRYLVGWRIESFQAQAQQGRARTETVWMNYEMFRQRTIFDFMR